MLCLSNDNDKMSYFPGLCNMPMNRAPNGTVQFVDEVNGTIHTSISVAAVILKYLIERVKKVTEMNVSRFVVIIPANFKQEQRLATKEAI